MKGFSERINLNLEYLRILMQIDLNAKTSYAIARKNLHANTVMDYMVAVDILLQHMHEYLGFDRKKVEELIKNLRFFIDNFNNMTPEDKAIAFDSAIKIHDEARRMIREAKVWIMDTTKIEDLIEEPEPEEK